MSLNLDIYQCLIVISSASPRFNDHFASDFPAVAEVIQPLPNLGDRMVQIRNISGFVSLPYLNRKCPADGPQMPAIGDRVVSWSAAGGLLHRFWSSRGRGRTEFP